MNKSHILRPLPFAVFLACCLGQASAAPYGPEGRSIQWSQPNGQSLDLRVFGDDYYARTETVDGYTVVYNRADRSYHYAAISADGSALTPSGELAGQRPPANLTKHLDLAPARIEAIHNAKSQKYEANRRKRWAERVEAVKTLRAAANAGGAALRSGKTNQAKINAAPVVGEKMGLTIIVQFPDDPRTSTNDPTKFPTTVAKIERFCNFEGYQEEGNTGSVRDYYFDQSGGKLTYTQKVTQIVTMPKARNYYNFADYPANTEFRGDASRVLIIDAINTLKEAGFDFSGLTTDANNLVEATNVFFAGRDSGVWAEGLWPQQWNLATPLNVGTKDAPMSISNFQITNISNGAPVIGTFCHENGHLILGYPDIYSAYEGEGVGEHCLMGSGNYLNNGRTPSPINAHFKDLVGWANITEVTPTDVATISLPTTGNIAYRINNPQVPEESYVIENRGAGDRWAQYSDDKGIAIWHIDERVDGNNDPDPNSHYGVALIQADGEGDLEAGVNRGDNRDLFDLGSAKFNDDTNPSAKWWNRSRSNVKIEVQSDAGATMDLAIGGIALNTIKLRSPNGGEVIYPGSAYPMTWESNIQGNVKIELFKGGVLHTVLAANQKNTDSYTWNIPATLPVASDYSIKVSSLTNTVAASDTSDGNFSLTDQTFPADGKMPYGWIIPGGTKYGWKLTNSAVYEGTQALVSQPLGDGKTAAIAYSSRFLAGSVGFYVKTSSETKFDVARFYIDGVAQVLDPTTGGTSFSGDSGWKFVSFPLKAGKHTLKWTYEKDDSYGDLEDCAWIDGITVPATTQEIAVEQPVGIDLTSATATIALAPTRTGETSAVQTFTIRNLGTADLFGLKTQVVGTNAADFKTTAPKVLTLAPGASTTFTVAFQPGAIGDRSATVRILSNDVDESPFLVNLTGTGLAVPLVDLTLGGTKLTDNKGTTDFGKVTIGTGGVVKGFKVTNLGSGTLSGLAVSANGSASGDFKVEPLTVTTLAPGESTIVNITFAPVAKGSRKAALHIASNDTKTGVFDINLAGTGVQPPKQPKATLAANTSSGIAAVTGETTPASLVSTTSVEVVGGVKYRSLTVTKTPGAAVTGTVQVSPNLLDWYSGKKHTTVLVDDATTLKVRDNTPLAPGVKRYIRLK